MAEIVTKAKIQLRVGGSPRGERTPGTATKLLINHGKPNFTIQRSASRVQPNDEVGPLSPTIQANSNNYNKPKNNSTQNNIESPSQNDNGNSTTNGDDEITAKSTTLNGVSKPAVASVPVKQPHQTNNATENEAIRVVLRRTVRAPEPKEPKEKDDDDSVPEFIRRQRRIQERLAKENILDFEKRRSGYFTQVMISPSSPSRTSFMETMASPAIVPSLEMTPSPKKESEEPAKIQSGEESGETQSGEATAKGQSGEPPINGQAEPQIMAQSVNQSKPEVSETQTRSEQMNGHSEEQKNGEEEEKEHVNGLTKEQEEEEEVAKAIEEVNKAVAGEDDVADEPIHTKTAEAVEATAVKRSSAVVVVIQNGSTTVANIDTETSVNDALSDKLTDEKSASSMTLTSNVGLVNPTLDVPAGTLQSTLIDAEENVIAESPNKIKPVGDIQNNEEPSNSTTVDNNKLSSADAAEEELRALAQLKFEIREEDAQNVIVTPVLRTDKNEA